MSTAPEIIEAQRRVWQMFVDRKIPRKHWPKHFASPAQLQLIMEYGIPDHEKALIRFPNLPCNCKK